MQAIPKEDTYSPNNNNLEILLVYLILKVFHWSFGIIPCVYFKHLRVESLSDKL